MRVLFCGGSPKAPSWAMRGLQLSDCVMGWDAINSPTAEIIDQYDVLVLVKRFNYRLLRKIRASGKPLVLDILDFWPQGEGAVLPKDIASARRMAKKHIDKINPDGIICANRQMASDLTGLSKNVTCIYHHARLDAKPLKFAPIAWYDGCIKHAEKTLEILQKELSKYHWKLKIGKPTKEGGALIAVRDDDAWLARQWKSNVKAANAIAYNLRLLANPENGYMETINAFGSDSPIWIDENTIEHGVRQLCQTAHSNPNYDDVTKINFELQNIIGEYRKFLGDLL